MCIYCDKLLSKIDQLTKECDKLQKPEDYQGDCCGNGCSNCVKEKYYEELDEYESKRDEIREKIYDLKVLAGLIDDS